MGRFHVMLIFAALIRSCDAQFGTTSEGYASHLKSMQDAGDLLTDMILDIQSARQKLSVQVSHFTRLQEAFSDMPNRLDNVNAKLEDLSKEDAALLEELEDLEGRWFKLKLGAGECVGEWGLPRACEDGEEPPPTPPPTPAPTTPPPCYNLLGFPRECEDGEEPPEETFWSNGKARECTCFSTWGFERDCEDGEKPPEATFWSNCR